MRRTLKAPKNPELLGRLVASLRVLAGQRAPMNESERGINDVLASRRLDSGVAKRMIGTFDSMPKATRTRLLGDVAAPTFVAQEAVQHPGIAPVTADVPISALIRGRIAEVFSTNPDAASLVKYKLKYQGFFCEDQSSWDRGSGSDEIYFVTSAVSASDNSVKTVGHPLGHEKHYGDVDTDEERVGPVAVVWEGNSDVVSLVVTAIERDEGDPDAYRDEIDTLVKASIALLTKLYPPAALVALFHDTITDAINWLVGTDDDPISVETLVLPRALLELHSGFSRGYYIAQVRRPRIRPPGQIVFDNIMMTTHLMYHFTTVHSGGGAKYVVCFDVERNPPHPNPIIL